jgi:long-chain acyl-CoA synthetase
MSQSLYMLMLNSPELHKCDLSSLTRCTVAGQTMPLAKMQAVEERFRCPLLKPWGMTELAGAGPTHPMYALKRLGSVGLPLPGVECRIVDPDDASRTASTEKLASRWCAGPLS